MSNNMLLAVLRIPLDLWLDDPAFKVQQKNRCFQAANLIERMTEALEIIKEFNNLKNDKDAYLFNLVEYALGETDEKPDPVNFGL
jgi:hypothetical protein